jgi:pyruvate/2-oxoglutarate dehydrogenase complex dihydrolipoamide dehydrogenase (E3) component
MPYDLAVIGAGSAGLAAATFAARMGAAVVLIEAERVGGDCTWTGCVPSKALIHAARVVRAARTSGWLPTGDLDFAAVMAGVRDAVRRVSELEDPETLRAAGVEVVMGRPRFRDTRTVEVDGRLLRARRFVVCTGAELALPPIPGLLEAPRLTYRTVFDLERLPRRLLVLGGGPVGLELAQAFRRLGSEVALLEQQERLLPVADPEASAVVEECFRQEGIEVALGTAIERVESEHGEVAVTGAGRRHSGESLLVAVGRTPRTAGLALEEIGVRTGAAGIEVDASLRTSLGHVYAAGDVTGALQFTHYAVWQGYAAARNALFPGSVRGVRTAVPWAVFTDPEVAQVGLTEAQAGGGGRRIRVHRWPVERIDRAQAESDTAGFLKLITANGDRLLGATIVGAGAADLANQLAIALEAGVGLSRLARVIHVYPTRGYGLLQLASEVRLAAAAGSRGLRLVRRLARGR